MLTPEHLEKLQAGRAARKPFVPNPALVGGLKDDDTWVELASKSKVRLPHVGTALTTGLVESWLRKLGVTLKAYYTWSGEASMSDFIEANPTWSTRSFVGLLLEARSNGQFAPPLRHAPPLRRR